MIRIKRIYDPYSPEDGRRILVDRVWPRGMRKDEAGLDEWLKDLAPSTALRKWFGHDPARWEEFQARYRAELDAPESRELLERLARDAEAGTVTLLYGAKDERHNQAVVIRQLVQERLKGKAA